MQIEEGDVFKFNCENINEDDFVSLQIVVSIDDLNLVEHDLLELQKQYKVNINAHGLLVLAKSDLKLSYLMHNNTYSIKTMLRS